MSILREIEDERKRQVLVEGYSLKHDDDHNRGELAMAAAAYAVSDKIHNDGRCPYLALLWPKDWVWRKSKYRRRNLIKACALIVAEIERLDRAQASKGSEG